MGKFTYNDGIAVWKLAFYAPCLVCSVYIAFRHGLMKSSGWIYLTVFALLRIIGSAAQLDTITNTAETPETIAIITSAIGLSPLLLATLGLIGRVYYSILKQPASTIFSIFLVKILSIPAAVALILCIVGATSANQPQDIYGEITVKIGIIIYAVLLAALMGLAVGAAFAWKSTKRGEGFVIASVLFAMPFLTVRIIYSLLAVFSHLSDFSIVTNTAGSTTIALFLNDLAEAVVVLIFICCGLKVKSIPDADKSTSATRNMGYRFGRGDFGTGRLGLISLAAGAISAMGQKKEGDVETQEEGTKYYSAPSGAPPQQKHAARDPTKTYQDRPGRTAVR